MLKRDERIHEQTTWFKKRPNLKTKLIQWHERTKT